MGLKFFENLGLDTKSLSERKNTIGGSDITTLASGDPERILKLFQQKTGKIDRDDLTMVWAVIMGHITEEANLEWSEHYLDLPIIDRQKVFNGIKHPFMRCTVDGVVKGYGLLSFIKAGDQPTLHEIKIDREFQEKLINVAKWFMGCIEMDIEPTDIPVAETPIPIEDKVPVDMQADPKWKAFAEQWIQTLGANEIFKGAEANIKKLVPKNASEAFGHGISVKVAKNNSKRISLWNN